VTQRAELERHLVRCEEARGNAAPLPFTERANFDLEESWYHHHAPDGLYLIPKGHDGIVVTVDRPRRLAGAEVRGFEWLAARHRFTDTALHLADGILRRYASIDRLPTPIFRRFEELGTIRSGELFESLPLPEMRPRFLVRIPEGDAAGREEVRPPDPSLPPCYLLEPWRVTAPALRDAALPLIEEPAAARAVLSRTLGGVYLPGNPPLRETPRPRDGILVGALPYPTAGGARVA
jgi:hypothetical protein